MKKKIKDLSIEDCDKICVRHICENCPLDISGSYTCHFNALQHGSRLPINAETEVEIDE